MSNDANFQRNRKDQKGCQKYRVYSQEMDQGTETPLTSLLRKSEATEIYSFGEEVLINSKN